MVETAKSMTEGQIYMVERADIYGGKGRHLVERADIWWKGQTYMVERADIW
jgi:hypothetical protein